MLADPDPDARDRLALVTQMIIVRVSFCARIWRPPLIV